MDIYVCVQEVFALAANQIDGATTSRKYPVIRFRARFMTAQCLGILQLQLFSG